MKTDNTMRTFTHDLKMGGDALAFDGPVIVRLVDKSGRFARLEISAPAQTRIRRTPVLAQSDPMQTKSAQALTNIEQG